MSNKEIFVSDEGIIGVKKCFALYDFDERRILSRKFFSNLNLPTDKTDQEILKSFKHSTSEEVEKTIEELSKILQRVKEYHTRIKNHSEKLEDLSKKFAVEYADVGDKDSRIRFKHTKFILMSYKLFVDNITALGGVIREEIDGMKNIFESICRGNFAERLKQIRQSAGMTQREFAKATGFAQTDIANYERAMKLPGFLNLKRLIKCTNTDANFWLGV